MALLQLKDIGKIYVSEGNVAVGIRGVNLSFEQGEFVAVTGKSGSGKSTLLNVISGMDTYEEGELYIEGESTSHYLQPDWEVYREKYISFIFQDYNIIESFTVLQNVELALMHIEDRAARRARAKELLERVGMTSHLSHKGSRLSGGQKQRTVIARALAKDSPIILADEPTGNLDSVTSHEIIQLLREVSKDKLVIVVTHNFDSVKDAATRHIRIFDGAVESDKIVRRTELPCHKNTDTCAQKYSKGRKKDTKNGAALGWAIFAAKPKLSIFLCALMLVGILGVFLVTALCGEMTSPLRGREMFSPIPGRVVITTQSGRPLTDEELQGLRDTHGATSYLHYDMLLDHGTVGGQVEIPEYLRENPYDRYKTLGLELTYNEDYGDRIVGRYPTAPNEVLLRLPISHRPLFGKDTLQIQSIQLTNMGIDYQIVGISYFYDNNQPFKCLLTAEGFRVVSAQFAVSNYMKSQFITASVLPGEGATEPKEIGFDGFCVSFELPPDRIALDSSSKYRNAIQKAAEATGSYTVRGLMRWNAIRYNYYYVADEESVKLTWEFGNDIICEDATYAIQASNHVYMGSELYCDVIETTLAASYRQASLFFEDDSAAHRAADALTAEGYVAVPADTVGQLDGEDVILGVLQAVLLGVVWLIAIVFLAFFLNLCSIRALEAFRGDMAIMRSMGIPVRVIRIGMYVRMLLSLIPGFLCMAAVAVVIFTSPRFNPYFVFLYPWQYALIVVGILLLSLRITHNQIRKLFHPSVKKALKGGVTQ